jgi:hypothetical protein
MLPFNRDQVIMSQEDNTCDLAKFRGDFGWEPQPFREMVQSYAKQLSSGRSTERARAVILS